MQTATLVRHGSSSHAFEIREQAMPEPGPGQLRIRVACSGLNFADVLARLGLYQEAPPLPSVLGYEVTGWVDALGAGVNQFKVGQPVLAFTRFGGYASHAVVPAFAVVELFQNSDLELATALATQYSTAYYCAYEVGNVQKGDRVLIHAAAGGVGLALIEFCRMRGCEIWGTAGSEAKLQMLREMGVQKVINYRESQFDKEIPRKSLDLIFDSIGGDSVKKGMSLLRAGGRMLCFGAADMAGEKKSLIRSLKTVWGFGWYHPVSLLMKSQGILGINMLKVADQRPEVLQRCMKAVVELYQAGKLKPVLGKTFPVSQIAEAHDYLGSRKSVGKVVLAWPRLV